MRKIALINLSYLHSENNNISNDSEHSAHRVSTVDGDVTPPLVHLITGRCWLSTPFSPNEEISRNHHLLTRTVPHFDTFSIFESNLSIYVLNLRLQGATPVAAASLNIFTSSTTTYYFNK